MSTAAIPTELTAPGSSSILNKKIRPSDLILTVLIDLAAAFSILLLIAIMGYVFFRGLPQISLSFLTSVPSTIKGIFGIAGNIVNTLYIVILTLLIATPIGVGSAIYLNEYAKPGKIVRLIEFTTETLSGHCGGEQDRADHVPFGCTDTECTAAVGCRNRF